MCHERSSTLGLPGRTRQEDCKCDDQFYTVLKPKGKMGFSHICQTCPVGAVCSNDRTCALQYPDMKCRDGTGIVGRWELTEDGLYKLRSCPRGMLLVNSTVESQRCSPCETQTYTLDYELGCSGGVCGPRKCLPCPMGAQCKDSTFSPKVPGSEWQEILEEGILHKRITQCPSGYILTRGRDAAHDQCTMCEPGKYSLMSSSSTNTSCLACPAGAECSGGGTVRTKPGFWRLRLEQVDERQVFREATCVVEGQLCAILSARALGEKSAAELRCTRLKSLGLVCAREMVDETRRQSMKSDSDGALVMTCDPGACGDNGTCLQHRAGPLCGICEAGYTMTMAGCSPNKCPSGMDLSRYRSLATIMAITIAVVLWIALSWRPTLTYLMAASLNSCYSGRFLIWQQQMSLKVHKFLDRSKVLQIVKVYISHFQILGSFAIYTLHWPPLVRKIFVWGKILFHYDIVALPRVSCLWPEVSFLSRLGFYTVGPMLVCAAFLVPVAVASLAGFSRFAPTTLAQTVNCFYANVSGFFFLVYPILSLTTLQTMDCNLHLGLLKDDYREVCPAPYSMVTLYSLSFFVLFPLGIPCFNVIVLTQLQVRSIVESKVGNAKLKPMIKMYLESIHFDEIQRVASLVSTGSEANDEKMFRSACDTLFDQLLKLQDGSDVLNIKLLQQATLACRSPDPTLLLLLKHVKNFKNDGTNLLDLEEFRSIMSSTVSAAEYYAGKINGVETIDQLTDDELDTLLLHEWPISYSEFENDESYAVRQQLDEFRHAVRRDGRYKVEGSEVDSVCNSGDNTDQEAASLKNDLQELEMNGFEVGYHGWLEEFDLAENVCIRQVKGIDGLLWRMRVRKLSRKEKISDLLTIATMLIDSEIIPRFKLSWRTPESTRSHSTASTAMAIKEDKLVGRMGLVLLAYRVELWWWHVVDILHKFVMIAILRFVFRGSPAQLVLGALITFAFFVLHVAVEPYVSAALNSVQTICLLCQFLILFVGIIFDAGEVRDNNFVFIGGDQGSIQLSMNAISSLFVLLISSAVIWPFARLLYRQVRFKKFCRTAVSGLFTPVRKRQTRKRLMGTNNQRGAASHNTAISSELLLNVLQSDRDVELETRLTRNSAPQLLDSPARNLRSIVSNCPGPIVNIDMISDPEQPCMLTSRRLAMNPEIPAEESAQMHFERSPSSSSAATYVSIPAESARDIGMSAAMHRDLSPTSRRNPVFSQQACPTPGISSRLEWHSMHVKGPFYYRTVPTPRDPTTVLLNSGRSNGSGRTRFGNFSLKNIWSA